LCLFWSFGEKKGPHASGLHASSFSLVLAHNTEHIMSRRLYLGRLPPDSRQEDVTKFFEGEGRIVDCRVMTGFGFVEFENSQDAELAMNNNGSKPFLGQK
jgi:RNA recognition motif-containing protein